MRRRGRRLALAAAGLALAAGVFVVNEGSLALFSDNATASSGSFTSGKLDLTVGGQQGNPTAYAMTTLTLATMLPGESYAETVTLANAGDVDFTWSATAVGTGGLGPALTTQFYAGGTRTNNAAYPRTGTCSGTAVTPASPARVNKGASQVMCVVVTLPLAADNTYQSQTTGGVTITVAATQLVP